MIMQSDQITLVLVIKQILPVSTIGNVQIKVWRICMVILGCQ